jgi:IMP dehydrogenase/GMP reductase
MEIEIGRGKKGRRAYGFDDIAIVPSRRTRDPDDIDISWKLGPYQFELPMLAAAMDGVVSPETAGIVGRLGGLAVLNLEGIFTRYEDADEQLERIAALPKDAATREMQDIYREPVKPELIARRIAEIKQQKVVVAASLTPQRVLKYYELAMEAGLDVLVIQGTVVSGEHVSNVSEPLNLKEFIPTLDVPVVVGGCASYPTGLHLMRTGAAGVLVGVGPGAACTTRGVLGIGVPQATAIADVAHARSGSRRDHDRLAARARIRGAGARLSLGHGDVSPNAAAGSARGDHAERQPAGDPGGTCPRERRHVQSFRWPAYVDGHLRSQGPRRVQSRRGRDRAGAADRGQGAAARSGRGHGSRQRKGSRPRP